MLGSERQRRRFSPDVAPAEMRAWTTAAGAQHSLLAATEALPGIIAETRIDSTLEKALAGKPMQVPTALGAYAPGVLRFE
jgi:hypothetical protein